MNSQDNDKINIPSSNGGENDEIGYVMPKESFKKHRRHHKHRHSSSHHTHREQEFVNPSQGYSHSGKTKDRNTPKATKEAMTGYVFAKPRRRKKYKRVLKRAALIFVVSLVSLALLSGGAFLVLRYVGESQFFQFGDINIEVPDDSKDLRGVDVDVQDQGKIIKYNGDTYRLNEKVANVVFLGIDDNVGDGKSYMVDAIYIAAVDTQNNKVSVISVSRDIITDVDVYSSAGSFIGTEKKQLSYAFSFGKDKKDRAKNTETALSKLFFGMPFKNYYALNMDAIVELNDSMGGVTVSSLLTFEPPPDYHLVEVGDEVTLLGRGVELYVRYRDEEVLDSNNDRMQRQIQYISAFLGAVVPAVQKDLSVISKMYNTVKVNSTTSLTVPQMTFLASSAVSMISDPSNIDFKSIDGEIKAGQNAELYADDKALLELMLDVFYNKE